MTPGADFFRALPVSGKGLALLGSVSVHVAVALAAMRGAPHAAPNASTPTNAVVEFAALDLAVTEAPQQPILAPVSASAPTSARHHHDYPVPPDHDAMPHDPSIRHVLPLTSALDSARAAVPAVIDSPAPAAPRFVMTVGPAARAPGGTSAELGNTEAVGSIAPAGPVPEASVDSPAKLVAGSSPGYTHEAEAAGIEADVPLEIVVDSAGAVIGARALAHVGYGLDEAALRSVRGYRFSPARRGGKALAVRMHWLMRFQLR
ncbi:MAG: TonB family protein [Pseudomonadota bacterium]